MNTLRPLFLACLGLLYCAMSLHAAPGDLDPTFGVAGKATISLQAFRDRGFGLAIQPDGKIIVVGSIGQTSSEDATMLRYDANGVLDATFGTNGVVFTNFAGLLDQFRDVFVLPDGKILCVGITTSGTYDFAVARFEPGGAPDNSFDGDGKVSTPVGSFDDQGFSGCLLPDGRFVVVGGSSIGGAVNGSNDDIAIVRYSANGSLDLGFNTTGKLLVSGGYGEDFATSAAMQADGKLLVGGYMTNSSGNYDFAVLRLNENGSFDDSFGGDGVVTTAIGAGHDYSVGMVLQADEKIVLGGVTHNGSNYDFCLVRYLSTGALDPEFGTNGKVIVDMGGDDTARHLGIQGDGKILLAGYSNISSNTNVAFARFTPTGALDPVLGGTGKATTDLGSTDYADSIAVQGDGKIVIAGWTGQDNSDSVFVTRYLVAPSTPVVTTGAVTGRTETSALLGGTVNPGGAAATVYFEYGLTTAYGSTTTPQPVGLNLANVQHLASGLISGATYHYRVVATNAEGTTVGQNATFSTLQPTRYDRISEFSVPTGTIPYGGVEQGADGNFYGTTSKGGINGMGTVYRVEPNGRFTTLHHFSGLDGREPRTRMIQASDGNLYGTTYLGGTANSGTVFRMTLSGQVTTVHDFTPQNLCILPLFELCEASDGYLYGVTRFTGYNQNNQPIPSFSIYRVAKTGGFSLIASSVIIPIGSPGGLDPRGPLVQGSDGALYGTTTSGGVGNNGIVYKLTLSGQTSTVYSFSSANNGLNGSYGSLIVSDNGHLFGAASGNGSAPYIGGVFSISTTGVYNEFFRSSLSLARNPFALTKGQDGSLWGLGSGGDFGKGVIFKLLPTGEAFNIYHFPTSTGFISTESHRLIQAADGTYWGVESGTGVNGSFGSIFRVNLDNSVTTVVRFTGFNDRNERASLIQTTDGTLIASGSSGGSQQKGNVFSVSPAGSLTSLVSFDGATRGSDPGAVLVKAGDGNFYGTARTGGASSKGTVFRMTPAGVVTVLTAFDGANGAFPEAGLALGGDGNLYGTTKEGGSSNLGTVFRLTTAGVLTVLHHFSGADGSLPLHRLILAADGHLYGTTSAGGATGKGLIFRLTTASGAVTTVAELNGTNGQAPNELRQLPDGSFVGTTRLGGSGNLGTVFAMTAEGTITMLHHFNGINGQWPESVLARAPDGSLYGTTSAGGTADGGTLFKIVAGSVFVPVMDFGSVPDEKPTGPVFFGQDGNLYGTTRNSVFRFLFPGAPIADAGSASSVTTTSAVIDAKVNARGSSTQSTIEYGIDGVSFPLSATAAPLSVSGYTTTRVGATLAGLVSGTRYYYRLRSVSSAGTTVSPVASFATQSLAYAATTPATGLGPTSATLNGIVNAFENSATVTFEYGTDGNTFPFSIAATPGTVTGDADTPVAAAIAGLTKGVTYYFRVRATTTAGTTISGATSFRTLIEPLATTGPALALSTTTARVTGTVQARDADTQVFFEYGTSPTNFPNIIAALPGLVTGDTPISVAADLPNLAAGVTYYFRVRASSAGGLAYSAASSFQLQVLSGFTQVFPPAPPASEGFLVVNLTPAGILHGWRFVGEQQWRASGVPAGGLTTGDRDIEFRPVPGYNQPPTESVGIVSGEAATVITRDYYASSTSGSGGLSVTLKPDSITTGPDRAQWRLLGENDAQWRDSGAGISSLIAGSYLIECKPVTGRATPPNVNVIVSNGATAAPTITYFLPDATAGAPPSVLAFESVTGDTTKPYAHVGQIRSNAGSSSGFVVKARVVATAAHVVWDDGTLSAAQGLQWLFQRHRGTHEPKPVFPRGFYLFDGYAAQRVIDNSPGDSSPQSQTLDVAAMYFDQDAGRGGYGGFLASDLPSNEFLLSNANKMLVGYPVDGVAPTSQGRMHATAPFNVVFNAAFGRTFTTSGIRSSGGNSGGPLCVQFEGGAYYPAAIYLGGDNQTVVRAIDSAVIDLFNRAEVSGNGGGNNTGGGITHTSVTGQLSPGNPGRFQILIEPAAARTAGAGWSLVPASLTPTSTYRQSGAQTSNLSAGDYKVVFVSVGGFQPPVEQSVTVTGGQVNTFTYTYAPLMTPQESWRQQHFSTTSNTGNAADTFDFDGDGFTNAQEYAAGTNPTLSGDFFKVTDSQRTASTFTASTTGKAGRTYTLQRSTNLTSWTPVGSPQGPLASDGAVTLQDTAMPNDAAFYRIVVTGP